jgi:hypothetical protein
VQERCLSRRSATWGDRVASLPPGRGPHASNGAGALRGHAAPTHARQSIQPFLRSPPCSLLPYPSTIRLLRGSLCPSRFASTVASLCSVLSPTTWAHSKARHIWNLSCTGWRLSGDLPMRPGETLSLTIKLPNEQHIEVPEAVVRWSRGQEFAVENVMIEPHTHARLQHYVMRLVQRTHEHLSLERSETYG